MSLAVPAAQASAARPPVDAVPTPAFTPAAPLPPAPQPQPPAPQPAFLPQQSAPTVASFPVTPTPVVFETVDPNRGRQRVLLALGGVVLALVAGTAGYFAGASGKSKGTTVVAGPSASASAAASASADPSSAKGFFGTALVGGVSITDGQTVTGPSNKMTFSVPPGWQTQIDPTAPTDARYAIGPYACPGHGDGACQRGLVVQNLRLLNGGWSDPKTLVLGMGQLLYQSRIGAKKPTNQPPVKQEQVTVDGRSVLLALWHVPMVADQGGVPDAYCGVLAASPVAGSKVLPVLQICLDDSAQAPALSVMDQIANSIKISA